MIIKNSLVIGALATLLLVGCSTSQNRDGYGIWPYQSIIKDDENNLYIPIISNNGYISDMGDAGKLAEATLYKLQSNSLIKTMHVLSDFAYSPIIDEHKFDDGKFAYLKGINVENEFHPIVTQLSPNSEYLVMENDSTETKKLDKYIETYYKGKINYKEILSDIQSKLPKDTHKGYHLRVSLYPDGLYIIYPSAETVDYKSKTTKVPIAGSIDLKGYYVSYYRYYPITNPSKFTEVKLPFLIDIENE